MRTGARRERAGGGEYALPTACLFFAAVSAPLAGADPGWIVLPLTLTGFAMLGLALCQLNLAPARRAALASGRVLHRAWIAADLPRRAGPVLASAKAGSVRLALRAVAQARYASLATGTALARLGPPLRQASLRLAYRSGEGLSRAAEKLAATARELGPPARAASARLAAWSVAQLAASANAVAGTVRRALHEASWHGGRTLSGLGAMIPGGSGQRAYAAEAGRG